MYQRPTPILQLELQHHRRKESYDNAGEIHGARGRRSAQAGTGSESSARSMRSIAGIPTNSWSPKSQRGESRRSSSTRG